MAMKKEKFLPVQIDKEKCSGHMECMRICPSEAIRVRNGKAYILEEKCIGCGECIKVCPEGAITPLTGSFSDFSQFKYTIAVPSPSLYGQFHHDIEPPVLLEALKRIGFDDAQDVAGACEAVTIAIQELLSEYRGPLPLIGAFCPAVVRLIQFKYPDLAELLIPIDSPMEIAAREAKRRVVEEKGLKEEEIGAIYITPCPAKMTAIFESPRKEKSYLDGVISIADLYNSLLSAITEISKEGMTKEKKWDCGIGLSWAIMGGQTQALEAEYALAVGGMPDVVKIFEDIESGKLRDIQYVECHSCHQGCVSGSLTVDNPYVARSKIIRLMEKYGKSFCNKVEEVKELYKKGYFKLFEELPLMPLQPLDTDISKAIAKMRQKEQILEGLPKINCGACGAPNCRALAEDVVLGRAKITDCVFQAHLELRHLASRIMELADRYSRSPVKE
ncbi:4Fe-4S binding protein [Candidatus Sumerlaeota bacterium]|nr:4Fe-4S binding protein [Candidatus Sumerlaeota bacterium]